MRNIFFHFFNSVVLYLLNSEGLCVAGLLLLLDYLHHLVVAWLGQHQLLRLTHQLMVLWLLWRRLTHRVVMLVLMLLLLLLLLDNLGRRHREVVR
jgi:hypothetical protein